MINNRNSNTSLAKEVQRKEQAMAAKSSEDREKRIMLIAYIVIGSMMVLLLGAGIYKFSSSDEKQEVADFATPQTESDKYNSKLEALEAKQENQRNENLLDIFSVKEDSIKVDTAYQNRLKDQLANYNNNKSVVTLKSRNSSTDVYGDYSMWEEEGEKDNRTKKTPSSKELTYEEALDKARAAYLEEEEEGDGVENVKEKVVFRAAVYRTQFLVPGERIDLMTTQEFIYNNMRFKKGLRFYAVVDIKESRVLFDINNIAQIPLSVEVRDVTDGRIGLYSSRAGELWGIYQEKLKQQARSGVGNEISNTIGVPVISSSIQVLSTFFSSKQGRKQERLKMDNDSQLIITIL